MTADQDLARLRQAGATAVAADRYMHYAGELSMRTAEFHVAVLRQVRARGLRVLHGLPSQARAQGWPDLVITSPYGTLFRTLRDEHGGLSEDVIYLLRCLLRAGLDVAVWRPEDLHDGTIENQLDVLTGVWNGSAIQATCENCHRRVIADKGSRRFCSDRCRERARYLRKKAAKAAAPS